MIGNACSRQSLANRGSNKRRVGRGATYHMEEMKHRLRRDKICCEPDRYFIIVYPGDDELGSFSLRQVLLQRATKLIRVVPVKRKHVMSGTRSRKQ